MNRARMEAKVIAHVNRVLNGGRIEDDFVEAKSEWLNDTKKAARIIAAMANAAHGETILWIIGLDEDGGRVVPLDSTDPADWWQRVESGFADKTTPGMQLLQVETENGPVVALFFESDRAPYLVTTDGRGGVSKEVPWRSATGTRTASRVELLSMLNESVAVPEIELISANVYMQEYTMSALRGLPERTVWGFSVDLELFFDAAPLGHVMLPRHRWSASLLADNDVRVPMDIGFGLREGRKPPVGVGVHVMGSGLVVYGPDMLKVRLSHPQGSQYPKERLQEAKVLDIELRFPISGASSAAVLRERFEPSHPNLDDADRVQKRWRLLGKQTGGHENS